MVVTLCLQLKQRLLLDHKVLGLYASIYRFNEINKTGFTFRKQKFACRELCLVSVEEAEMEAIRTAKQAARERLNTLCAWASADDECVPAPAHLGSLQLLADAVDLRICGPIPEFSLQAPAVAPAAQAGATITTGQPVNDGRWGSADCSQRAEPGLPLYMGWQTGDASAGHRTMPPCHPVSWRCTETAGDDRPPWLPQWHHGNPGVAGQSAQVLPIH